MRFLELRQLGLGESLNEADFLADPNPSCASLPHKPGWEGGQAGVVNRSFLGGSAWWLPGRQPTLDALPGTLRLHFLPGRPWAQTAEPFVILPGCLTRSHPTFDASATWSSYPQTLGGFPTESPLFLSRGLNEDPSSLTSFFGSFDPTSLDRARHYAPSSIQPPPSSFGFPNAR